MKTWKSATAVLAGCLVGAASTQAASYTHTGPFVTDGGVYSDITETSITDAVPLFGSPAIMPNNLLLFEMTNYSATADNNSSDITTGALEFTFESDPGEYIQTVILSESGTYSVIGDGSVSASGTLTIQYYDDVAGEFVILADPIQMVLFPETSFPVDNEGDGTWSGYALIDLQSLGIQTTEIIVALDNNLIASAAENGSATITKDTMAFNAVVPEPASMVLMGLGCLMMIRKR